MAADIHLFDFISTRYLLSLMSLVQTIKFVGVREACFNHSNDSKLHFCFSFHIMGSFYYFLNRLFAESLRLRMNCRICISLLSHCMYLIFCRILAFTFPWPDFSLGLGCFQMILCLDYTFCSAFLNISNSLERLQLQKITNTQVFFFSFFLSPF